MYEVTMPKLSDSMAVGKIIEWKVKEGEAVSEGDVLAEVESDKAAMELECFAGGTLQKIVHGNGEEVPVGEVIAFIAKAGEQAEPAKAESKPKAKSPAPEKKAKPSERPAPAEAAKVEQPTPAPKKAEAAKPVAAAVAPPEQRPGARIAISPYARKLAEEQGIDLARVKGSGPDGRIVARDIETAAKGGAKAAVVAVPEEPKAAKPASPAVAPAPAVPVTEANADPLALVLATKYDVDLRRVTATGVNGRITVEDVEASRHDGREALVPPSADDELPALELAPGEADVEEASFRVKTQARRVVASKHAIPHFYVTQRLDVTTLMARKDDLKAKLGVAVTHVLMLACLKALKQHPEVNRSYDHGKIIAWKGIHLGLAVDTEQGLTVAVLRDAQDLSLQQLVEQTTALVDRARQGKMTAADRRHPTFTITNLGMFDVEHFAPIINPPSSITLAVATAQDEAIVRGGALRPGKVMRLTAACDHRIVDGATVARFMADLKKLIENPETLLMET